MRLSCLYSSIVGSFAFLFYIYGDEPPPKMTCSAEERIRSLFGHHYLPSDHSRAQVDSESKKSCPLKHHLSSNKSCPAREHFNFSFGHQCLPGGGPWPQASDENKRSWKIHHCRSDRPLLSGGPSPVVGFLETHDLERYLHTLATFDHEDEVGNSSSGTLPQFSCVLVNFFDPNCPFSTEFAPSYRRLARLFPELHLLAVDVSRTIGSFSSLFKLGFEYGLVGTPTLVLLKDAKLAARLEAWEPINLTAAIDFILKHTDLTVAADDDDELDDRIGLPVKYATRENLLLAGAASFSILCVVYAICRSSGARLLWRTLRRDWDEMQEGQQQQRQQQQNEEEQDEPILLR